MREALWGWPSSDEELIELQARLGREAESAVALDPWSLTVASVIGGCFVAFARGEAGPGKPGDGAWAAAVAWRPVEPADDRSRPSDHHLRGRTGVGGPRRADDVLAQAVVAGPVPASYRRSLLAAREGPVLAAAVAALDHLPEVLLVDATGLDHPRGAGLAVHLGAALDVPTVGVTQRPLVAAGPLPELRRGASSSLDLGGRRVASWVCTRTGARPVIAHAGWRTTPDTAVQTVLAASTAAARTPVPLQEARRVAREARRLGGSW